MPLADSAFEDSSTEDSCAGDDASRSRLAIPALHRDHKRAASTHLAATRNPGTATANKKDPYEELWEEAEKAFREAHKGTADKYNNLEKELRQRGLINGQIKRTDRNESFQYTLVKTKVFLNRSRKSRTPIVKKKISRFLMILSKSTTPLGAISAADPMIAQPVWSGVCILLQVFV